jgi:bifunctional non-homologous end joining protein LigD
MSDGTLHVGRRDIQISHPDKRLFADPPITKLELARHYERVAGAMVPLVRDRPLALQTFPDGIEGKGFFMKSEPKYFPDWIRTATVPKRGGTLTQVLADDAATLVYLAGQNVVTPHVWLSRADEPHTPDRLISWRRTRWSPARAGSMSSARCDADRTSPRSIASPGRWPSGWSPTTHAT